MHLGQGDWWSRWTLSRLLHLPYITTNGGIYSQMAILPDAPSIYKIEAQFLWAGEKAENVHYLSVFGTSPQPSVDDVAAAYVAWYNATGKGQMSNDTALQQVVVTDLTTHSAPRVFYTTGLPISGASPDDSVPNNVAPIVTGA